MKRIMQSGLVVVLTIISVFAMISVKGSNISGKPVFIEDEDDNYGKPEGTGYMFDDYDKDINIPFEREKDSENNKDNESGKLEQERYRRMLERNLAKLEPEMRLSGSSGKSGSYNRTYTAAYSSTDIRGKSKVIISKVQNNITLEDKISLFKIVKKLSLSDLNDIKNAIINGTTNAESIKLWTMLRNKLPKDEYIKLENIIAKYE